MDWQSSRGSRSNRIQKNPGERNPLTLVVTVFVLMIGAVLLGYLISQLILPALVPITPAQPQSTKTTTASSASAVISSAVVGTSSVSVPLDSSAASEPPSLSVLEPSSTVIDPEKPSESEESTDIATSEEPSNDVPISSEESTPNTEVTAEGGDDLPILTYYRVQVTSLGSYEGTETYLDKLTASNYVASVVPKGGRISVQAGIFGQRSAAQEFAETLQSEGYDDAWVTDWSIAAFPSGTPSALRTAQISAVQSLAEAVRVVLNGGVPTVPTAFLPEGSSETERQEWNTALAVLRTWVNDSTSRRPSQLQKIIEALETIYAWY